MFIAIDDHQPKRPKILSLPSTSAQAPGLQMAMVFGHSPFEVEPNLPDVGRRHTVSFDTWMHAADIWPRNWAVGLPDRADKQQSQPLRNAS
jgi:hypothetical protein